MKKIKALLIVLVVAALSLTLCGCESLPNKETDPFYVLVLGKDSRTGTVEEANPSHSDAIGSTDTMMLVRVVPEDYSVTIVSVSRDTKATYNDATIKIKTAYHEGGAEAAMQEVQELTGVYPDYYLCTSFVEFENLVDDLGGVRANVPINMSLTDIVSGAAVSLSKGEQNLDGKEALVLARMRKQYAGDSQEACRQVQDRQLVQRMIEGVAEDPVNAAASAATLLSHVETNWDADALADTVCDFANNADKLTITCGTGPYAGDIDPSDGLWYATRDEDTWAELIAVIEEGGDPNSVVAQPTVAAL